MQGLLVALADFTRAYIRCALWTGVLDCREGSTEESPTIYGEGDYNGTAHAETVCADDLSPECREAMERDCELFYEKNSQHFHACKRLDVDAQAGHDFWLTRNRSGSGFLDGDWYEPEATLLSYDAHQFGEVTLILTENGVIHDQ